MEGLSPEEKQKVESLFESYKPQRYDEWGTSLDTLLQLTGLAKILYEKYFRVNVVGLDKIPEGPALFIANHGGQIPIDGMVVVYSFLIKAKKPRLLRAMVERWVPTLPFIGSLFLKGGQIVGEQKNCLQLLKKGQSVLVFPEGVRGSGKTFDKRYQLQTFPLGFYRLAQEAGVPIIPVTLVGTEETYPSLANLKHLAKVLNAPYIPITPTFPLLGLFGLVPLPARISVKVLDPVSPHPDAKAPDSEIKVEVEKIRKAMQNSLNEGLAKRGERIFSAAAFSEDDAHETATVTDTPVEEVTNGQASSV